MMGPSNNRGIALVLVLFVTALLTILVVEFAYSMQVYASVSNNNRDEVHLRAGLQSGLATAQQLLLEDALADARDDVHYDHPEDVWGEDIAPIRLDATTTEVTLVDEAGKFPLNSLIEYTIEEGVVVESAVNEDRLQQLTVLFDALDIDTDLVDVVVDWMDHDSLAEPNGAEESAYVAKGYVCRNGPLTDIAELEMLQGFTREIVWGEPDDDASLGLADVCTVFAREDNLVNANTAPEIVLEALGPGGDIARQIVRARERDPFIDTADINDSIGDTIITQFLTTESGMWSVRVMSETIGGDKPLQLAAEGILYRYVDDGDSEEDPVPTPGLQNDETNGERVVIEVLAWREVR